MQRYNSEGNLIANTEEGLKNFWDWFGDSKVVDSQGRPLVVYHGTISEFDTFDIKKIGNTTGDYGAYGRGFYFTQAKKVADSYGSKTLPVYLSMPNMIKWNDLDFDAIIERIIPEFMKVDAEDIKKDLIISRWIDGLWDIEVSPHLETNFVEVFNSADVETKHDILQELLKYVFKDISRQHNLLDYKFVSNAITEQAKEQGADGILAGEISRYYNEFIAFEPNQIKSVNNKGTFNPNSNNIYECVEELCKLAGLKLNETIAYAGTRTDYEKPSLDAIGSGEGGKVHGWGLYYALNPDIAENYRTHFSNRLMPRYKAFDSGLWKYWIENNKYYMNLHTQNIQNAHEISKEEYNEEYLKVSNERLSKLDDVDKKYLGQVHQVEVPDYNELLDEDKPYNEQSEYVKKALKNIINSEYFKKYDQSDSKFAEQEVEDWKYGFSGGNIYDRISNLLGGDKEASLLMDEYGIKGMTYNGYEDGRCFVIFNPDNVKVISKKFTNSVNVYDNLDEMCLFAGLKLYESIVIEGKEYNGATEQYDYIKVYKNPDLEWLSEEVAYQSYKFIYANKVLYVWKEDWMHSEVMNLLPNIHNTEDVYCGAFEPNKVYIWSEISPNDDFNEACEIFESVFGDKLKIIYPNGYDFGQCS